MRRFIHPILLYSYIIHSCNYKFTSLCLFLKRVHYFCMSCRVRSINSVESSKKNGMFRNMPDKKTECWLVLLCVRRGWRDDGVNECCLFFWALESRVERADHHLEQLNSFVYFVHCLESFCSDLKNCTLYT